MIRLPDNKGYNRYRENTTKGEVEAGLMTPKGIIERLFHLGGSASEPD